MAAPTPEFLDPDDCPWLPAHVLFRRLGFEPLPTSEVDDFQLPGRLWEFVYALAARRVFLCFTDHLSDRELYAWLRDSWLSQSTADIPPEAGWNCHIDVTEAVSGLEEGYEIWLRYHAPPHYRDDAQLGSRTEPLPPHEDPPHDRDRWLPGPPGEPLPTDSADDFFPAETAAEDDPLGLQQVDAEIRAERRRQEFAAREEPAGGEDWQRPIEHLRRAGCSPIPPAELTDETLTAKLWELLHHLACRGFYVHHTNHLSDRELYTGLWESGHREEVLMPGKRCLTAAWHHDFIGSGSDEDEALWLRFYATPEDRARHAAQWPKAPLPPREAPPFNRDWRLPLPPF